MNLHNHPNAAVRELIACRDECRAALINALERIAWLETAVRSLQKDLNE